VVIITLPPRASTVKLFIKSSSLKMQAAKYVPCNYFFAFNPPNTYNGLYIHTYVRLVFVELSPSEQL
jgi:hypothetical protein